MVGKTAKHGTPRWILIATGVAGLVTAILVAATKYYELYKSRAEALQAEAAKQGPSNDSPPEKSSPLTGSSKTKGVGLGFTAGSIWDGYTDEPIGLKTKIVVESVASGRFKGVVTPHQAGVEWYSAKITGTINEDGEVEFKTRLEDQSRERFRLVI